MVQSINLFEQPNIKERTLMRLLVACTELRSICLNGAEISTLLLTQILENSKSKLCSLSLHATNLKKEDIEWFCDQLDMVGNPLEKMYINVPDQNLTQPYVITNDSWFVDEELVIES
jgi:hypothetical protein